MKANLPLNRERRLSYRALAGLAVFTSAFAGVLLLLPGSEVLSFMVSTAMLGGLLTDSPGYTAAERQQLSRGGQTAFEWLLLTMLFVYAAVLLTGALPLLAPVAAFLNGHWPVLVLTLMCGLLGLAGLRNTAAADKETP